MRAAGLAGVSRRKGAVTTVRDHRARPAPDLVNRAFTAEAANRLWVADITYIPTQAGFLYLAVVLDTFSRRIVGWSMADHLRTVLVLDALDMALGQRRPNGFVAHVFGRVCAERGVKHRLTKPYHPWTNGQAERMVRTIKDATVRSFHYASIDDLRRHVRDWLLAYNYAKQLKALRFKAPIEALKAVSIEKPELFARQPSHDMLGLNT